MLHDIPNEERGIVFSSDLAKAISIFKVYFPHMKLYLVKGILYYETSRWENNNTNAWLNATHTMSNARRALIEEFNPDWINLENSPNTRIIVEDE